MTYSVLGSSGKHFILKQGSKVKVNRQDKQSPNAGGYENC